MASLPANMLHVVVPISNPVNWTSRMSLAKQFIQHMLDSGVKLYVVECALGEMPFELSSLAGITHIGVRHNTLMWHKESICNVGLSRVDPAARYIAFIDGDITFRNPNWASNTIHSLQQYAVVQPWQTAYDLGPNGEHLELHTSFASLVATRKPIKPVWTQGYTFGHPGYAWAYTRQALEWLGGLIDFAILGSSDHNMALAYLGRIKETFPADISPEFTAAMLAWQARATMHIGPANIGYVQGTLEHGFHGSKKLRNYVSRWDILRKNKYNPVTDTKRNTYGILELALNKPELTRDIDLYMRSRNEDSNVA